MRTVESKQVGNSLGPKQRNCQSFIFFSIYNFGGDNMKEKMFGFEIRQKEFTWKNKRPIPPKGYIEFNSRRVHPQAGECPNCGQEKPWIGPGKRDGGFQDRQIQNLWRNLERVNRKLSVNHPNWKPTYELFSLEIHFEKGTYQSMIKCHPSRYGIGEFGCCKAQIWHDFYDDLDAKYPSASWKYYYKPTEKNKNTLQHWL